MYSVIDVWQFQHDWEAFSVLGLGNTNHITFNSINKFDWDYLCSEEFRMISRNSCERCELDRQLLIGQKNLVGMSCRKIDLHIEINVRSIAVRRSKCTAILVN